MNCLYIYKSDTNMQICILETVVLFKTNKKVHMFMDWEVQHCQDGFLMNFYL